MHRNLKEESGYVLLLTMLMLSILTILTTRLFKLGIVASRFNATIIDREKAKLLAQSGIQLAISQLIVDLKETDTKNQEKIAEAQRAWAKKIIPLLNIWQTYTLKREIDGIDAEIKVCIVSEEGKINVNNLFDFKNQRFVGEGQTQGDFKKNTQALFAGFKKFTGDKNLFDVFEKFLKERKRPLEDVTELLQIPEFKKVFGGSVFYVPLEAEASKGGPLFLQDLFTIESKQVSAQAWFLSDALRAALNLKRVTQKDKDVVAKIFNQMGKEFPSSMPLEQLWDKQLQQIYGKDFKSFNKELTAFLNPKFEPMAFSVLCYATINSLQQKLLAIIIGSYNTEKKREEYTIKKVYWL